MSSTDPQRSEEPSAEGPIPVRDAPPDVKFEEADRSNLQQDETSSSFASPAEGAAKVPQPSFRWAILWSALPIVAQADVVLRVSIIAWAVVALVTWNRQEAPRFLEQINPYMVPVGTLTTALFAVLVSYLMLGRDWGRRLGWRNMAWPQWCGAFLLVIPMAIIASEIGNYVSDALEIFEPEWLHTYREDSVEVFLRFVHLPWWLVFLSGCCLPGLGEEIYCRGFISRGLIARHGVVWGTLMAAFLFGAMHLDPLQSVTAFVLGLGLQYVFLTTRSLLAPIMVHTLNNAAAFVAMRYNNIFPVPGVSRLPDGSVTHTPPLLMLATIAAFVATACLLYQIRTLWRLPDGAAWSPGYVTAESPPRHVPAKAEHAPPSGILVLAVIATQMLMLMAIFWANRSLGQ